MNGYGYTVFGLGLIVIGSRLIWDLIKSGARKIFKSRE